MLRVGGGEFLLIIRRPVWQGLPQIQQPVVASGEPPALQCRTPSRHHLELQDRRDYTPADRAARTCCSIANKREIAAGFEPPNSEFDL
ncbi:hypothetical protein TNCV_2425901 [Trichonephila clavipes]|nr:hypothetical protein TNCV_2425901 [Trichonephila clavipes]